MWPNTQRTEPLTIITKRSILDVAAALDLPLASEKTQSLTSENHLYPQRKFGKEERSVFPTWYEK